MQSDGFSNMFENLAKSIPNWLAAIAVIVLLVIIIERTYSEAPFYLFGQRFGPAHLEDLSKSVQTNVNQDLTNTIEKYKSQISVLEIKINKLTKENSELKTSNAKYIKQLENQKLTHNKNLRLTNSKLKTVTAEFDSLSKENAILKQSAIEKKLEASGKIESYKRDLQEKTIKVHFIKEKIQDALMIKRMLDQYCAIELVQMQDDGSIVYTNLYNGRLSSEYIDGNEINHVGGKSIKAAAVLYDLLKDKITLKQFRKTRWKPGPDEKEVLYVLLGK